MRNLVASPCGFWATGLGFFLLAAFAGLSGCAPTPTTEHPEPLSIQAEVLSFQANASTDHYEEGGFASFHATDLKVLNQERLERLLIYHPAEESMAEFWKKPGAKVSFKIQPEVLNSDMVFQGALEEVQAN